MSMKKSRHRLVVEHCIAHALAVAYPRDVTIQQMYRLVGVRNDRDRVTVSYVMRCHVHDGFLRRIQRGRYRIIRLPPSPLADILAKLERPAA